MNEYIIGSKEPAPPWCRDSLMTYRRMDGSSGVEFHNGCFGTVRIYRLFDGDMLKLKNGFIQIVRKNRGDTNDQLEEGSH